MSSHLPLSRIKTIMKSSADVDAISKDSLLLVAHATELFIKHLAKHALDTASGKDVEYNHLAEVVNSAGRYDFLSEIIPRKITVREFKKRIGLLKESSSEESDSSDSDSDDSNSSTSSDGSSPAPNSNGKENNTK